MNFWSIFHNKKSATGCCEVGPTDDWKNAKSAPELSRVLRRIYFLPSWKYLTSLRSNIILKLLVRIHVVQQIYLAAIVASVGWTAGKVPRQLRLRRVLGWIHLLPSGIYFISLIVDILKMPMWIYERQTSSCNSLPLGVEPPGKCLVSNKALCSASLAPVSGPARIRMIFIERIYK